METLLVPVVAMITASPVAGATPPTHVEPVAQVPPVAVDVMVAAFIWILPMIKTKTISNLLIAF